MTPFEQTSMEAAAAFLQTVVVVDNMAEFDKTQDVTPETLIVPDEFGTVASVQVGIQIASTGTEKPLNAGAISSSFAAKGLVCAVIRPSKNDRLTEAVVLSSERSDILVLDWQMFDDGDAAIEIIKSLARRDDSAGGKLRLIAIYTSESPLAAVADKIAAKYSTLEREPHSLTFRRHNTRIIVLAKEASPNAIDEAAFAVTEEQLPERLIKEFARFAQGLLPNATMAAIAGIRDNTHRILARFDQTLDGPMLTHRALLKESSEAEDFVGDLIMSEIEAQVPIHSAVKKYAGKSQISDFIAHKMAEGLQPKIMLNSEGSQTSDLNAQQLGELIEGGHAGVPEALKGQVGKSKLYERLYLLFGATLSAGKEAHSLFAVRAKLKRDALAVQIDSEASWPKLRLGALLMLKDRFWICLTPLCDCTRLTGPSATFLFAELTRSDKGQFDLVIPNGTDFKALELARQRTTMMSEAFRPGPAGDVVAVIAKGVAKFFPTKIDGTPNRRKAFVWLGELKPMQAQRFAQQYANNLSRIGLDDFEWHRLQFPSGSAN